MSRKKSPNDPTKNTSRLNLDLPLLTRERLERLRAVTQSSAMTDIVKRALALFEHVMENEQNGGKTILRSKDGQEQVLVIF